MFKWYLDILFTVLVRPILFYTKLPPGEWEDESLTFCGINCWILALFTTLVVFINQLIPVGATLVEGITGFKLLLISPVMLVLAFMFFVIVYSILGGVFMALFISLFYVLGALMYWGGRILGGKGQYLQNLKTSLYSSAVILVGIFPILMILLSKRGILDFTNYKIGYNIVYSFAVLYLYGLDAIAIRKTQKVLKWQAFVAALLPAVLLIILGMVANKMLPRLANWIT